MFDELNGLLAKPHRFPIVVVRSYHLVGNCH